MRSRQGGRKRCLARVNFDRVSSRKFLFMPAVDSPVACAAYLLSRRNRILPGSISSPRRIRQSALARHVWSRPESGPSGGLLTRPLPMLCLKWSRRTPLSTRRLELVRRGQYSTRSLAMWLRPFPLATCRLWYHPQFVIREHVRKWCLHVGVRDRSSSEVHRQPRVSVVLLNLPEEAGGAEAIVAHSSSWSTECQCQKECCCS